MERTLQEMDKTTVYFLQIVGLATLLAVQRASAKKQPVDLANPLVDSTNFRGFFFNSATRPFGMVQPKASC
ncbi:hypothetical protein GCM10028818_44680 [Spirosoma horti]